MLIVDAQVHIWSQGIPTNRAHRQIPRFSKDDLLKEMDEGGVTAAVIHPPGWDPNGNQVAIDAARQHPDRLAILGHFPLDKPESRKLVAGWKKNPGMLGLRFSFTQPHMATWMTDGTMNWLWPEVEKAGIPVALQASANLSVVGKVAQQYPRVKLIIDHLGRPSGSKDAAAWANLPELLALGKHPNVAVKATGAPSYTSAGYPFKPIHGYLRQIYEAFGPQRMFWGTDITRMPCSWNQCVTLFTEELPWLPQKDKELVMGRALCNWIGWKLGG
ncbi:MAG: hypothetical protein FJ316_01655 [SAR202 cluster bacterium]|nr:hypothetical protein [SAR202 cluster bacterium]